MQSGGGRQAGEQGEEGADRPAATGADGSREGAQPRQQEAGLEAALGSGAAAAADAAPAGAGDSSAAAEGEAPPSKRPRLDLPSAATISTPAPPVTAVAMPYLTAYPGVSSAAPPDPSLVGAPISGAVDAVGDCAYFVTLHLAGQDFKGV